MLEFFKWASANSMEFVFVVVVLVFAALALIDSWRGKK